MKYARIVDNRAVEIMDRNPVGIHNPTVAAMFTECPDNIEAGWILSDGEWSAPVIPEIPDPEPIPQAKFTSLAFMDLVGDTNMVTLLTLAKTDQIAELLVKKIDRALVIDFDDEERGPQKGLLYLLSQGHLSQAEYDRIVSREFPTS